MLSARSSRELSATDGKRAEHQYALVILGQGVHQFGEKVKSMRVRFQALSGGRRGSTWLAEDGGAAPDISQERFAGGGSS